MKALKNLTEPGFGSSLAFSLVGLYEAVISHVGMAVYERVFR